MDEQRFSFADAPLSKELESILYSERHRMFRSFLFVAWAVELIYLPIFLAFHASLSALAVGCGAFILFPINFVIEKKNSKMSPFCFFFSCISTLYFACVGMQHLSAIGTYFIPCSMLPFVLFGSKKPSITYLLLTVNILAISALLFFGSAFVPPTWQVLNPPSLIFSFLNTLGACFVSCIFVMLFRRDCFRLRDELLKRTEYFGETLKRNENFLRETLGTLPLLISYVDKDLKYKYVNTAYGKWFKRPESSIINTSMRDLLGPQQFDLLVPYIERVLAGEKQQVQLFSNLKIDKQKYLQINYIPDIKDTGVEGFYVFVQDLTALKMAESEAIEKEQRLNALFESMSEGMICLDAKGLVTLCNDSALRMLNRSSGDLIGQNWQLILQTSKFEKVAGKDTHPILRCLAGEDKESNRLENFMARGGRSFPVQYSVVRLHKIENQTGVLITFFDISDRKEAEGTIERQRERLIASEKLSSLGEMAAGIAHEINNPLAIIVGKAEQIKRILSHPQPKQELIIDGLEKIDKTAARIAKIVKGLQSFSRDSDKDPMVIASIQKIVEDVVELCEARFRSHSIDLQLDLAKDLLVECREAQIGQVIMNLLSNAHDAVGGLDEKWVRLRSFRYNEFVCVAVTDSGKGIAEPVLRKIMQPFFTTKEVGKGTGLGLSISKGITEDHGGKLIYDEGSKNTSFVLYLPIYKEDSEKAS